MHLLFLVDMVWAGLAHIRTGGSVGFQVLGPDKRANTIQEMTRVQYDIYKLSSDMNVCLYPSRCVFESVFYPFVFHMKV